MRLALALAAVVVLPPAARSAEAHWPETLTIGTGSPGGTYYDYGEGLARLLTRKLDIPVFARSTEGPTENIKLLEAGEIQLAFVTLGVAQQGWNGSGRVDGRQAVPRDARDFPDVRHAIPVHGAAANRASCRSPT